MQSKSNISVHICPEYVQVGDWQPIYGTCQIRNSYTTTFLWRRLLENHGTCYISCPCLLQIFIGNRNVWTLQNHIFNTLILKRWHSYLIFHSIWNNTTVRFIGYYYLYIKIEIIVHNIKQGLFCKICTVYVKYLM